ncbi:MAG TPA: PPC domain-containing protein [Aggregatilineales bacterium]|nr:PPC domain-containing protein [Aggregatilineales bacterium]
MRSSISAEVPQRFYFFEGKRGEVVSIQMERTQGNLQTVAILLDEDLNELARDGGNQPLDRARITGYSLSKDGDYYIMATRVDFSDGSTAGDFALTLEGRSGIGGSAFLEIVYDTEVTGVISDELPYETFIFQGDEGDIVTIHMDATSDNLDPLLTLYQDGKQIVFDDDSGDGKNAAIIDFRLPEDGVYQIEAARFNRAEGETIGGYILTLEEG